MRLACRGLMIVVSFWMAGSVLGQNASRFDAIMRDMRGPARVGPAMETRTGQNEIRVSFLEHGKSTEEYSVMQSSASEPTAAIPRHLLPDIYVSEPSTGDFQQDANPLPVEPAYDVYVPDRFIFSSASQPSRGNVRANYSSILNDTGCCDEWNTFCLCQDCCHDLGLHPWSSHSLRRGCGVGGQRLHGAKCGCQSCGSTDFYQPQIQR